VAIIDFARHYVDQSDRPYEKLVRAVQSGRFEAREGVCGEPANDHPAIVQPIQFTRRGG
jgi:hypothetical protein